jgi:hypothetical protein
MDGGGRKLPSADINADTLVREVTGRTHDRDQDQTVSAEVAERLFDRLAGPDG